MNPLHIIKSLLSKPSKEKNYTLQIHGRGEDITYSDSELKLELERTYCDGHRLYCDNTQTDSNGNVIQINKRIDILDNLCHYFNTKESPTIFVLDVEDKDHDTIEAYINELCKNGHKVTIESDSAEMREQSQDDMYISILEAGKKLSINGLEINSVQEYWLWKKNNA